jgi:hypothetical protein
MVEKFPFLIFRSNVLSEMAMTRDKTNFPPKHWSKDDIEKFIKEEYVRHWGD